MSISLNAVLQFPVMLFTANTNICSMLTLKTNRFAECFAEFAQSEQPRYRNDTKLLLLIVTLKSDYENARSISSVIRVNSEVTRTTSKRHVRRFAQYGTICAI